MITIEIIIVKNQHRKHDPHHHLHHHQRHHHHRHHGACRQGFTCNLSPHASGMWHRGDRSEKAKSATFSFCFRSIFVKYTNTFLPLFLTINFKLIMICKRTRLFLILSFGREQSCASEKITDNALSQYLLQ